LPNLTDNFGCFLSCRRPINVVSQNVGASDGAPAAGPSANVQSNLSDEFTSRKRPAIVYENEGFRRDQEFDAVITKVAAIELDSAGRIECHVNKKAAFPRPQGQSPPNECHVPRIAIVFKPVLANGQKGLVVPVECAHIQE
jgi:hypothetical protein